MSFGIWTIEIVGVPAVSKHLTNIFEEGEMSVDSVVSKMEITAAAEKRQGLTEQVKSFPKLFPIFATAVNFTAVKK